MNVAIFWDIAPSNPYVNGRFGGTYHLHLHSRKSSEQETSVQQLAMENPFSLLRVYDTAFETHLASYAIAKSKVKLSP
jgi:hypothetical protein